MVPNRATHHIDERTKEKKYSHKDGLTKSWKEPKINKRINIKKFNKNWIVTPIIRLCNNKN